jgi:hypothetical protein
MSIAASDGAAGLGNPDIAKVRLNSYRLGVEVMARSKHLACAIAAGIVLVVLFAGFSLMPAKADGEIVPVSMGTSVTVWEQTGWIDSYTFTVGTVMGGGGFFWTSAQISERYTVTSDGTYLKISCYRDPPTYLPVYGPGGNIVAARLDGIPGYSDGLWASVVVSYKINVNGTEESVYNALGPDWKTGPYNDMYATLLGDYDTEIVLGFTAPRVPIEASLDIDSDVINIGSSGKYVTAYVELPAGYDVCDIDVTTVMLNDRIPATGPSEVGDCDKDGVPDLMVKFDKAIVVSSYSLSGYQTMVVTGDLVDGTAFRGTDEVYVMATPMRR